MIGRKQGLRGYEIPWTVILEPVPWTVDNGKSDFVLEFNACRSSYCLN